jgi:hypothetical protein
VAQSKLCDPAPHQSADDEVDTSGHRDIGAQPPDPHRAGLPSSPDLLKPSVDSGYHVYRGI